MNSLTQEPPSTLTVVTVIVRYEWQDAPECTTHSIVVDYPTAISNIISSWTRPDARSEFIDFRVDEYALIPF